MHRLKVLVKQSLKAVLRRRKARLALFTIFVPVSYVTILISGIFDHEWYAAQLANTKKEKPNRFSLLFHYLLYGRRRGLTPSPFFIPEYFDARNWRNSVIDPLARYIVQKSNWQQPTSPLYRPTTGFTGRLVPPLSRFLKELSPGTELSLNIGGEVTKTSWQRANKLLQDNIATYRRDEELVAESRPVDKFDSRQAAQVINRYAEKAFKDNDVPLVSIVTPAWNREELIRDAIHSVQAQTFNDWEMLIVDDGSTDATKDIVREYATNDPRIKLIERDHGGVCKARNVALETARGHWVAFLDSDNAWTPEFLQTMLGRLIDDGYSAGYSAIRMENNGKIRYRTTKPNPELLKIGNYIDLNALVVQKSILDQVGFFDESLRRMVDYDLVCRINEVTSFCYIPIIGVHYTDHNDAKRITTTELVSWDGVIKSKNFINWRDSISSRNEQLISVVVPIKDDIRTALRCIESIIKYTNDQNIEVVLLDSSSTAGMNAVLGLIPLGDSRFRYVRQPASHDNTLGADYGFIETTGSQVVFVDQRVTVEAGWLEPLVTALDKNNASIIAPLQLHPGRTVLSAGVEFVSEQTIPVNILENHPTSDLKALGDTIEVTAAMSGCVAMSAVTFQRLHGLNPLYDKGFEIHDLCLRAAKQLQARTLVAVDSRIMNLNEGRGWGSSSHKTFYGQWSDSIVPATSDIWEKANFTVMEYCQQSTALAGFDKLVPKLEVAKSVAKDSYRWAIKVSAPSDERRYAWGDLYYAQSLAESLEKLGQSVAIDYHDRHHRPTSYLDDINLDLRGLDNYEPQNGKINLMWVISHPEKVTADVVKSFNKVYAAGDKWAKYMSKKSGQVVDFLPQCTDTGVFHPPAEQNKEFADKVLFVGNSRNVLRPIVKDAIDAGIDIAVYGGGWDGLIDAKYIKGTFIPNHKLHEAYGSAAMVLNDHWQDMRQWGFLSNRLFDAVASGACVITDDIDGIKKVFPEGVVQSYQTRDDLRQIHRRWSTEKVTTADRQRSYAFIKNQDSFDARAKQLLKDTTTLKAVE